MTTSETLAEATDNTRDLLYFYLSKLDKSLWYENPVINDEKLNSVAWELCHMVWAQDYLILKACANQGSDIAWLEKFSIGKPTTTEIPPIDEIKNSLKSVHSQSIEVIKSLTDKDLESPNHVDLEFKKGKGKLQIIYHHIRHEGGHIGHIGLLCKILGAKTI